VANDLLTIHLDPDSELARALALADDQTLLLESNGAHFRVLPVTDDLWANYDPEAVLVALRAVAGTMSVEEGERIKELIYHGREAGTRPLSRP
jgi:hypothetical protein